MSAVRARSERGPNRREATRLEHQPCQWVEMPPVPEIPRFIAEPFLELHQCNCFRLDQANRFSPDPEDPQ